MTGNSTQLGVGVIEHAPSAAIALRLTGSFVVGVMTGSLVGRRAQRSPHPVVLTLVALILRVAALLNALGNANAAIATTVIAMAVENAAFESDGNVHIGLTYMTGTLVKLGQRIADTVTGGKRFASALYLSVWSGLVLGAVAGAATYPHIGLNELWIAAGFAFALAAAATAINGGKHAGRQTPR